MKQTYKRRNYYIDPGFQSNFIMKFCAIVLVSSLLIGVAMFFILQNSTMVDIENTKGLIKPIADFIFPQLAAVLLIVAIFSSLVVLVLTLLVSHKIAGPIFRIQKEIELIQKGDLTCQFNIRTADQLQQLAKSLKEMTQTLRQKHLKIGGQCRSVSNFLEEKKLSGSQDDREKLLKMIKELYEMLSYFQV